MGKVYGEHDQLPPGGAKKGTKIMTWAYGMGKLGGKFGFMLCVGNKLCQKFLNEL
jgi:hypothetical protein